MNSAALLKEERQDDLRRAESPHTHTHTHIENWTHVYMNSFTRNSPYYHLLKYLLFLLKYPVKSEHNTGLNDTMFLVTVTVYGINHCRIHNVYQDDRFVNGICLLFIYVFHARKSRMERIKNEHIKEII
jgi:hypothetical protein